MKTTLTAGLLLVGIAGGFAAGYRRNVLASDSPPVITAQALRIVDSQGAVRAAISVNSQTGAAGISIFEPNNNNPRVILGLRSDGVGNLEFRDSGGTKRGEIVSSGTGEIRLSFWDQNTQGTGPRLSASVNDQSGVAGLAIFEPNNSKPRMLMGLRSDGIGSLEFRDSGGNKRAELNATSTGEVRLNLLDKDLKGGVILGSSGGQTTLVFNDSQPKHREMLSLNSSGDASAVIYDKDGKIVWQAPPPKN